MESIWKKILTSKNQNTCKIAAIKVEKAQHNLDLEIASTHLASTQNLSAAHPKYTTYGCFFRFLQGRLPLSRKSKKSVLAPHWQFHRRAYQRLNLLPRSWNSMLILCLKRIFFILPPLSALRVSRISRKFVSGRVQRYLRRAHQRCGIPLLYWCPEFLLIKYDSIAFPAYDRKFLSRRILGVLFRTQKAISPSRSPTAWFTSASLAS